MEKKICWLVEVLKEMNCQTGYLARTLLANAIIQITQYVFVFEHCKSAETMGYAYQDVKLERT